MEPAPALQEIGELQQKGVQQLEAKNYDEGIATFKKILELVEKSKDLADKIKSAARSNAYYNIACGYSLKKESKDALDYFEKSVNEGFTDWSHIEKDTDLDHVRNDARFKEIIVKAKDTLKVKAKENAVKLVSKDALFDYKLSVNGVKGDKIKGEDLLGKVVVVDLFADVDGKGGVEVAVELDKLCSANKAKGVEVVGILLARTADGEELSKEDAAELVAKRGIQFPVGLAAQNSKGENPQLKRAQMKPGEFRPLTLVLDRAGKLRARLVGADRNADQIQAVVDLLAAEKAPEGTPKKDEKKGDEKKGDDEKGEKKGDEKKGDAPKKDEPLF